MQIAHARKVRDVAPLACKTDKVDARVLADLCRCDLVPELWVPSLSDRELRERLRQRTHLFVIGMYSHGLTTTGTGMYAGVRAGPLSFGFGSNWDTATALVVYRAMKYVLNPNRPRCKP